MVGRPTATVVGGGIAGLAGAAALARAGWRVAVLERAPAFGEVGAGVAVTRNGLAALDALGVGEALRAAGHRTFVGGFQDPSGRWLLRMPDTRSDPGAATTIWGVHRRQLHAALLRVARDEGAELVTGAEVIAVRPGTAGGELAAVTCTGSVTSGIRRGPPSTMSSPRRRPASPGGPRWCRRRWRRRRPTG